MFCNVCKETKPEPQEYIIVNGGHKIPKPCQECWEKNFKAWEEEKKKK